MQHPHVNRFATDATVVRVLDRLPMGSARFCAPDHESEDKGQSVPSGSYYVGGGARREARIRHTHKIKTQGFPVPHSPLHAGRSPAEGRLPRDSPEMSEFVEGMQFLKKIIRTVDDRPTPSEGPLF